jgi:hypothetical protein
MDQGCVGLGSRAVTIPCKAELQEHSHRAVVGVFFYQFDEYFFVGSGESAESASALALGTEKG